MTDVYSACQFTDCSVFVDVGMEGRLQIEHSVYCIVDCFGVIMFSKT